ncbi:hypothetical protein AA103196_2253 [Ameyamaea chiangmaiensis NBRC 103196]|uniref:Phage tail lysozyme domain-containing protein n=1 Tax=Ameyamaea chiangmaiensis TaxID=442969 RepID=A0A850PD84_9PROT|nr:hypothetical protein [Ameyamaea chiangmaiensis]MBS4075487.1 hypothetical protein [Ameyamaea chiangmaiensis]NVN38981.1 hypothetical protein [Ameyamaea chiangmaiensis]GBQ69582.1 hypothetical protein AA103196_2253 [Ameyamaea chiangmaiensis NBRC 103196]
MINLISEAKHTLVIPTLALLPAAMNTPSAVNGLTGIGARESAYLYRHQISGGPALGYWQMEPATHDDCWRNFIRYRLDLQTALLKILGGNRPSADQMVANDRYACAMARVKVFRAPAPLPAADDAVGWARYWKRHYNSQMGAGSVDDATIALFQKAIAA